MTEAISVCCCGTRISWCYCFSVTYPPTKPPLICILPAISGIMLESHVCPCFVCGKPGSSWGPNVWSFVVWSWRPMWVGNFSQGSWIHLWAGYCFLVQPHEWAFSHFQSSPACDGGLQLVSGLWHCMKSKISLLLNHFLRLICCTFL